MQPERIELGHDPIQGPAVLRQLPAPPAEPKPDTFYLEVPADLLLELLLRSLATPAVQPAEVAAALRARRWPETFDEPLDLAVLPDDVPAMR